MTSNILKEYFKRNSTVNNFIPCYPANERDNRAEKCCFSDKVPHKSDGVVLQKSHDFLVKPINIIKDTNTQYLLY